MQHELRSHRNTAGDTGAVVRDSRGVVRDGRRVKAATIDVGVYSFNNFETLLATLRAAEMLGLDYTVETTPGEGWKLTLTHYAALADAEARRQDRREARRVRTREGGRNDG